MAVLAFDTATRHCAVVLLDEGRVLASRMDHAERFSHAEKLNVFIEELLDEAGLEPTALQAVAVGIGPGSYTGLRIGLSAAKGLCFALDIQLIGLSTLAVLVAQLRAQTDDLPANAVLNPMIDARRMEVFTARCGADGAGMEAAKPLVLDRLWCDALEPGVPHVVFGDGADKATALWSEVPGIRHVPGIRPSVAGLATAASTAYAERRFADLAYLVPDYGKEANVTMGKG